MSYTALYRKYRPQTFDDVVGQQHIVTTLTNALDQNKLAHAYLFSGPSGNGKTSIAKLFAKAINCVSEDEMICDTCDNCEATRQGIHPDIVEIDAASNNGVDEIRSLIEKVKYAPLNGKYKVYIIDEVHMLSLGAFNALLKTLEEPPSHVVFILATTEPHKVIPTIISRCQRYDFTRVRKEDINRNIVRILNNENIAYEDMAIELISELADGGVRESLSILEQTIAYAIDNIKLQDVRQIYGIVTNEEKLDLLMSIFNKDIQNTLNNLNRITDQGNNLERLTLDLIKMLKETVIYSYAKNATLLEFNSESEVKNILNLVNSKELLAMIDILMEITALKKNISDLHAYLELAFIKMINLVSNNDHVIKEVVEKVSIESPKEIQQVVVKEEIKAPINENVAKVEEVIVINEQVEDKVEEVIVENLKETTTFNNLVEKEEIKEPEVNNEIVDKEIVKEIEGPIIEKLDEETLLSLLAFANKEKRMQIDGKWSTLNNFILDIDFAKYAHKLKFAKLIAVGNDYCLVCVENQIVADDINSEDNQIGITNFIHEKLNEYLKVFAITETVSKDLIQEFRLRAANKTLPTTINVKVPDLKKAAKVDTIEEKAINLFGQDNFVMGE